MPHMRQHIHHTWVVQKQKRVQSAHTIPMCMCHTSSCAPAVLTPCNDMSTNFPPLLTPGRPTYVQCASKAANHILMHTVATVQ